MRIASRPCLRGLRRPAAAASSTILVKTATRSTTWPASAQFSLWRYSSSSSTPSANSTNSTDFPQQPPPPPPPTAPRVSVDIRHIRENVELYTENCYRRNYGAMADYPARILDLFGQLQVQQKETRTLREHANRVRKKMVDVPGARDAEEEDSAGEEGNRRAAEMEQEKDDDDGKKRWADLLEQARVLKQQLATVKADETHMTAEMQRLAAALPNLTSDATPDGTAHTVLSYINCDGEEAGDGRPTNTSGSGIGSGGSGGSSPKTNTTAIFATTPDLWRSHVHIGSELGLLDFSAASAASGWGWYYLLGDGARLEQALVQYALNVAHRHGWQLVSPPSIVRSGIAAACGFQPRDQGGEQQTYALEGLPLSLTATAEIPLAALYADATVEEPLPMRRAAVSRCYRAEAGARGASTKGLYRVHEFTKVEMFAWTAPDLDDATDIFDELVDVQTEILSSLGLPCRVLEMPATDLGASAYRKIDIEAFFPSRCRPKTKRQHDNSKGGSPPPPQQGQEQEQLQDYDCATGWGEVTSASICTDYQTRRLATRTRISGGPLTFPWTLNGTALAVPRVIAAILENGWDEASKTVAIPECLQPWMDGQEKLERKH